MKLLKPNVYNPGNQKVDEQEKKIEDIGFDIFKLNNRPKPTDKRQVMLICCFSEFGCETVGTLYCLPQILQQYPGKYKIVVGWHGREFLYRHLVDEFWGLKAEHMWLREKCRAFHHESDNLDRIEKSLMEHGIVVPSTYLGRIALGARCTNCNAFWGSMSKSQKCPYCQVEGKIVPPIIGDVAYWKPRAIRIPNPSEEKQRYISQFVKGKPVGIFARGRKCYGRNLQPEFYVKLIALLEEKGYSPIWLGEQATTQPCPVDHILDFSRMKEAEDLELTLSIIKQCRFTVQFWTASTRLAGMMGIPYLLFESPDQIYGQGQEGYRRNLCDFGPAKLSINHFLNVYNDNDAGLAVVKRCIEEMEVGNYEDVLGLVQSDIAVATMQKDNKERIGSI